MSVHIHDPEYGERTDCSGCREDATQDKPLQMVMYCPAGHQHMDEGEWATRPHKTHQCQEMVLCDRCEASEDHMCEGRVLCGLEWRPMDRPTVGIKS